MLQGQSATRWIRHHVCNTLGLRDLACFRSLFAVDNKTKVRAFVHCAVADDDDSFLLTPSINDKVQRHAKCILIKIASTNF